MNARNSIRIAAALLGAALIASGCGSDGGPMAPAPGPGGGGGGGGTPPDSTDDPPIPKPTSPFADAPLQSETYTSIQPLGTSFAPEIQAVYGVFQVTGRMCVDLFGFSCCGSWSSVGTFAKTWSDQLPEVRHTYSGCKGYPAQTFTTPTAFGSLGRRFLVLDDGTPTPPLFINVSKVLLELGGGAHLELQAPVGIVPLQQPAYLRRDRQWVREPLTDGSTSFVLTGSTSADFQTTRTSGIDVTKSETFAETITGTVGLNVSGVTAAVEKAITNSFTSSTSVSQETSLSFTYSVSGTSGKVTVFNVWSLVETYTFTDAQGNVLTDPHYRFAPIEPVVVRGVKHWLDATEFDQTAANRGTVAGKDASGS